MNAQDVPGPHLLIPVTPVADSRLCASFSGWGMEHKPNRAGSPARVSTRWRQWSPGLHSRLTSALPLTSPLCVALPSSFLNDCGLRFVPLIRQVAPEKKNQTKKKHNKTHHFFLLPSLQIIFKHLWLWQQQINKHSEAAPLSEPISLWPSLPQQFLSSLDSKTPAG